MKKLVKGENEELRDKIYNRSNINNASGTALNELDDRKINASQMLSITECLKKFVKNTQKTKKSPCVRYCL